MPHEHGRRRLAVRAAAVTGCAALLSTGILASAGPALASTAKPLASAAPQDQAGSRCHLGNGVKHVVEIEIGRASCRERVLNLV